MRAVFLVTGLAYAIGYGWAVLGFRRNRVAAYRPSPIPLRSHGRQKTRDRKPRRFDANWARPYNSL